MELRNCLFGRLEIREVYILIEITFLVCQSISISIIYKKFAHLFPGNHNNNIDGHCLN